MYVIAGAMHPEIARQHGEDYRNQLASLVPDLGVEDRVRRLHAAQVAAHRIGSTLAWPAVAERFATVVRDVAANYARKRTSVAEQVQHGASGAIWTRPGPRTATSPMQ